MLVPDALDQPTQLIDARDLADWMLTMVEERETGIYNANGPESDLTLGQVLEACRKASPETPTELKPVSEEFLLSQGVPPFTELPLWVSSSGEGMMQVNNQKAFDKGLSYRPLEETVRDTLSWSRSREPGDRRAGLSPQREQELLEAYESDSN